MSPATTLNIHIYSILTNITTVYIYMLFIINIYTSYICNCVEEISKFEMSNLTLILNTTVTIGTNKFVSVIIQLNFHWTVFEGQ